ncbi:MAG: T9SS type A sorting domain-containing protein [Candidatus Cloacimonetes bacterium]|nr:T9SS type A sorting domain-containing protein [Candidatus Cloacimonadota bacterium]
MEGYIRNPGSLNLYETNFHDNVQLLVRDKHSLVIENCDITDNSMGIQTYDSPTTIENSIITGNGTGVNLNYASLEETKIWDCEINNNDGNGLVFSDRYIDFRRTNIQDNLRNGIVSYKGGSFSNFIVNGEYSISNNGWAEYAGYEESYSWGEEANNISDSEYVHNVDKYILKLYGWNEVDQVDVSGSNETIDHSDEERFYPDINAFDFSENTSIKKEMFKSASEDMKNENYIVAHSIFEQIITDYPESIEAAASLQKIYFIVIYTDQNFDNFLQYIDSISSFEGSTLHRVKDDVITKTYMQKKEYDTAISRLETIIADPVDDVELVGALKDEAYCYVKLIEDGSRALPSICTIKPQNFREFQKIVCELESRLYENEEPSNNDIGVSKISFSNYPNPFNPTTTINFSIPEDSEVKLLIFNVKGQKVSTLVDNHFKKGSHSIEWNGTDNRNKSVASGIYFYQISIGKETAMKKMLLLK